MWFAMNLMIVPGMFVCSNFLISVCMFIVSKASLISSATVIVRAGGAECESKRAYVFRCLIFNLSGPCELLFLLCFIASWT